jgi:ParB-like chromosome segregation protein Spo0J
MIIEEKRLDEIKPNEYNPRKDLQLGDPEYEKLKRSIQEFGNVVPLVVNKRTGRIVGGHQRYKVLKELGFKTVQCVVVDLDERKEMALNIALNKIEGDWDREKLETLFRESEEVDMLLSGFDWEEIDELLGRNSEEDVIKVNQRDKEEGEEVVLVVCPRCKYAGSEEEFESE